MKTYFITGATGVIGSRIAETLLGRSDVRLKLLVRASSAHDLAQRAQALLTYWGPGAAPERIEFLRGDTTLPLLGMEAADHARMAQECTHLIHCAAMVRMNLPLAEARRSAVAGAAGLVHLARACQGHGQLEKVEFVSTVGVGGRFSGPLPEHQITTPRSFHNTYEQAKAEAEDWLGHAGEGLPITVHRPSMVVGDARTGRTIHFQVFYHLVEFLSGLRTRGVLPQCGEARLDIVPVDYVADAIVWSSTQSTMAGKVLHLCAGPEGSLPLQALRTHVCGQFSRIGKTPPRGVFLPLGLFRLILPALRALAPRRLQRAIDTLPVFLDYLKERQEFSNKTSRALLMAHGIELPAVDGYLKNVLDYYFHSLVRASP